MSSARVLRGKRKTVRRKIRDTQAALIRARILGLALEAKLLTRLRMQKKRLLELCRLKQS